MRIKKGSKRQAEDTHGKPDQSSCQGWAFSQAAQAVGLVKRRWGGESHQVSNESHGSFQKVHVSRASAVKTSAAWTLQGMVFSQCSSLDFIVLVDNFQRRKKLTDRAHTTFWLWEPRLIAEGKTTKSRLPFLDAMCSSVRGEAATTGGSEGSSGRA